VRIARYSHGGEVQFGIVEGPVEGSGDGSFESPGDGATIETIDGHPFGLPARSGHRVPLADVRLLAPMLPSKVVAVGRNYVDHAKELGNEAPAAPMLFLKPATSVVGQHDLIQMPDTRVDYEGELAVVVGRLCRDVPIERALDMVLGYTCANDVTAREWQKSDGQWSRAKGCDTFCPLGPWIETAVDPAALRLRTLLDGEAVQDGSTADMVFDVATLLSYVSSYMTLLPGDVLLTGTPAGIGPMQAGQSVTVEIEGIGALTNRAARR